VTRTTFIYRYCKILHYRTKNWNWKNDRRTALQILGFIRANEELLTRWRHCHCWHLLPAPYSRLSRCNNMQEMIWHYCFPRRHNPNSRGNNLLTPGFRPCRLDEFSQVRFKILDLDSNYEFRSNYLFAGLQHSQQAIVERHHRQHQRQAHRLIALIAR
jgi:hypothetical protein